jgi:hypothetical protein
VQGGSFDTGGYLQPRAYLKLFGRGPGDEGDHFTLSAEANLVAGAVDEPDTYTDQWT